MNPPKKNLISATLQSNFVKYVIIYPIISYLFTSFAVLSSTLFKSVFLNDVNDNSYSITVAQAISDFKEDDIQINTFKREFHSFRDNNIGDVKYVIYTPPHRRDFVEAYGRTCYPTSDKRTNLILEKYDDIQNLIDQEGDGEPMSMQQKSRLRIWQLDLWKYCILASGQASAFVDYDSVSFMNEFHEKHYSLDKNYVVSLNHSQHQQTKDSGFINSSFLFLGTSSGRIVANKMLHVLLNVDVSMMDEPGNEAWKSHELYKLVSDARQKKSDEWEELINDCDIDYTTQIQIPNLIYSSGEDSSDIEPSSIRYDKGSIPYSCSKPSKIPCCAVKKQNQDQILFFLQHPISLSRENYTLLTQDETNRNLKPYLHEKTENNSQLKVKDIEYMSTIREVTRSTNPKSSTPRFFDFLMQNNCLPTSAACFICLGRITDSEVEEDRCETCADVCGCFCKVLCQVEPIENPIRKEWFVTPPAVKKDPHRHVPRIIHQTWFEDVTKESYPRMSKLIDSWKKSGWEHHFYTDDVAIEFLNTHFPKEVRDAYDAIVPGAFKADLFRYCVLLIRGGVYVDVDVLLETDLDKLVTPDIGLMTPNDEPGTHINRRSCLWNGFIAVAPGHPIIAKTVELVINNINNRATGIDYDYMLCPNPVLEVAHSFDLLFVCGPCIFGGAVNFIMKKHMQDHIENGDLDIWESEKKRMKNGEASDWKQLVSPDDPRWMVPGRTVILTQNKEDMGAHRFTWTDRNLIAAATDIPDADDRPPSKKHYSDSKRVDRVFGLKYLYQDQIAAGENVKVTVSRVV